MWLIMGSYKKIGLSHEMGLIDTPLYFIIFHDSRVNKYGVHPPVLIHTVFLNEKILLLLQQYISIKASTYNSFFSREIYI